MPSNLTDTQTLPDGIPDATPPVNGSTLEPTDIAEEDDTGPATQAERKAAGFPATPEAGPEID